MNAIQFQELLQRDAEHAPLIDRARVPALRDPGGARHMVFYYCSGNRSAQACAYLAERRCGHVINLRGGYKAWELAKRVD